MTIHLKNALQNASSFIEIGSIVQNAKEDISFFGGRYIYVDGYKGSVDIDAIAARFLALQKSHVEPTEEERVVGRETVPLITRLYEINYSRNRNILTRIFRAVRDFFRTLYNIFIIGGYGTRNLWYIDKNHGDTFFDSYTYNQYQQTFGEPPRTGGILSADIQHSGCPGRYYPPGYFQRNA